MKKQSICFSEISDFRKCRKFLRAKRKGKKQVLTGHEVVGNALHEIAAARGDMTACAAKIEAEVALLPVAEQAEVRARIEELAPRAATLAAESSDEATIEKVLKWFDEKFGCTWCVKPDLWDWAYEGKGPSRRKYLVITDGKSTHRFKPEFKEQLFFFAMVASKALGYEGKVQLVLNLWGKDQHAQGDHPVDRREWWYSAKYLESDLAKYRLEVAEIFAYLAGDEDTATVGWHCNRCPLQATCQEGIQYLQIANHGRPVTPPPVTPVAVSLPIVT